VRDPEQPARQPSRRVEGGEVPVGLEEGVLSEIFSGSAIADNARDQANDGPLIAPDDLLERGLRPRQRLSDESGLGYRLEIDRDGSRSSCISLRADAGRRCKTRISA
jgi:hypothetical protein